MKAIFIEKGVLPEDDSPPEEIMPGLETYWTAWHILRDDRHFGAMGGCSGIYYSAMSQYARDHEIRGAEFQIFLILVRAMDAEYMVWISEKQKNTPPEGTPE